METFTPQIEELEVRKAISEMWSKMAFVLKTETQEKQCLDVLKDSDGRLCALGLLAFRSGIPKDVIGTVNDTKWVIKQYGWKPEMESILQPYFRKYKKIAELNNSGLTYREIGVIYEQRAKDILIEDLSQ